MKEPYTIEEKKVLVYHWQKSGHSQTHWCAEHGLKRRTFGSWVRKYSQPKVEQSSETSFIPLDCTSPMGSSFKLHYPGGLCLECPPQMAISQLVELLKLTSGV